MLREKLLYWVLPLFFMVYLIYGFIRPRLSRKMRSLSRRGLDTLGGLSTLLLETVRNVRRDANNHLKDLLKQKKVAEDEERRAQDDIQKLTDKFVAEIDQLLAANTVVTDAGSTKRDVLALARAHLAQSIARFVPAHPIAGAERSGAAAARADFTISSLSGFW